MKSPSQLRRMSPFARRLAEARRTRSWSVQRAAAECGYASPQALRNVESGLTLPPLDRLDRICRALNLDIRSMLDLWAREALTESEAPGVRSLLCSWGPLVDNQQNTRGRATGGMAERLTEKLVQLPLDAGTANFAVGLFEQILAYRKEWCAPPDKASRVFPYTEEFLSIEGMQFVRDRVVGFLRYGQGFYVTLVEFKSNCGAYHLHGAGRYVDPGIEFFVVLQGDGYLFLPRTAGSEWEFHPLALHTIGYYPARNAHAYLASPAGAMVILVIAVPFPPTLRQRTHGSASADLAMAIEFSVANVHISGVPAELARQVRVCGRPDAMTTS